MTPAISVIIPTHNRAALLRRNLLALARQRIDPARFEVIVVADGCHDDTPRVVAALRPPYVLTLIEQPPSGAAAARNRGTRRAVAPLLLFLDDDKEAAPDLVAAHLKAHAERPGGVVLGWCPLAVAAGETDLLVVASALWWSHRFSEQARSSHRFTFRDFCTGNVSLAPHVLDAVGGFDESFPEAGREDYELGARLLKHGILFRFVPGAAAGHHDPPSMDRLLARAATEGRADVLLIRKHPELAAELPLGHPVTGRALGTLWRLMWHRPPLATCLAHGLRLPLAVARSCKLRGLWSRIFGTLQRYAYWRGVHTEIRSITALDELRRWAAEQPVRHRQADFDLARGVAALEALLAASPVDGLRLSYGTTPIGQIAPVAGAEPLRPPHVRNVLRDELAATLLAALQLNRRPATGWGEPPDPRSRWAASVHEKPDL